MISFYFLLSMSLIVQDLNRSDESSSEEDGYSGDDDDDDDVERFVLLLSLCAQQ